MCTDVMMSFEQICDANDTKIWSEFNSSAWKDKSCQSSNSIQEKSSEDSICKFIKVKWLNIKRFDKLKTNLIDSDQIEYDRDEVREVWSLTVSQILQNCSRIQIDFEVSEENDMQQCFNSAREEFTTEDVV